MIEKIAEEWLIRGFTCDIWEARPGIFRENYSHKVDELFMLLDGEIELEINGEIRQANIDEIVFIPAHTKHSIRNIGRKKSHWLYGRRMDDANTESMAEFNR